MDWSTHRPLTGGPPTSIDHILFREGLVEDSLLAFGVEHADLLQDLSDHNIVLACFHVAGKAATDYPAPLLNDTPVMPIIQHEDLRKRYTSQLLRWFSSAALCDAVTAPTQLYQSLTEQMLSIYLPLARRSHWRLHAHRNPYKHGWTPDFLRLKHQLWFLVRTRRILSLRNTSEVKCNKIRELTLEWARKVQSILTDSEAKANFDADPHGPSYWRTISITEMIRCVDPDIQAIRLALHGS